MVILLYPVAIDPFGRPEYSGIGFKTVQEARSYQKNVGFRQALLIAGGSVYPATEQGMNQALVDEVEHA